MFRFQVRFNLENRFRSGSGREVWGLRKVLRGNLAWSGFKCPPFPFVWSSMPPAACEAARFPAGFMRSDGVRSPVPWPRTDRWVYGSACVITGQILRVAVTPLEGAGFIKFSVSGSKRDVTAVLA